MCIDRLALSISKGLKNGLPIKVKCMNYYSISLTKPYQITTKFWW